MAQPPDLAQLASIKVRSPLAIVGAFLYLIRDRFSPEQDLPWKWYEDNSLTELFIEAEYNVHTEVRDGRPGIFIDRDQLSYGKVTTGNLDQTQPNILKTQLTHYYSVGQVDLTIDCLSASKGESVQLADVVQTYLESSKYIIMKVFGFHDFSPIVMGKTQPFEKQTDLHQTTLNFRIEFEVHWATLLAAPALSRLGLKLQEDTRTVNTVLAEMYLKSTS